MAGKRAGLTGERSGLFYEATRIIDELRPAYCLFENVPGLLSSDQGRDFARVLLEMARIGYHGAWRIIDAQYLRVAQRRRRCFGLFSRLDSGAERCAEILLESEGVPGDIEKGREAGEGITDHAATGSGTSGTLDRKSCSANRGSQTNETEFIVPAVARTISCNTARGGIPSSDGLDEALIPAVAGCLQERDAKGSDSDTKPGHLVPCVAFNGDIARTLTARHDPIPCADRGMDVVAIRESGQGYWMEDDIAGTLRAEGENRPSRPSNVTLQGMSVRRLTPMECERLQGFPDGWTADFSDSVRYRMLGNAVCVNVAEWIMRRLAAALEAQ